MLMWGWLVDPILNSLNSYYKNCMVDSKENYKFDLGVKSVKWIKEVSFERICGAVFLGGSK